ncbi:hypothetical protein [Sphingomonas floccifaciens]
MFFEAVFFTVAVIGGGIDLLDGQVTLRRFGIITLEDSPGAFAMYVVGYVFCCAITLFGWFVLRSEWSQSYLSPLKPRFHDPAKTRPFKRSERSSTIEHPRQ